MLSCIEYIENNLKIKLFPYQKQILQAWEDGYEVRTARGIGRSFLAGLYGKYITYKLDKNNYEKTPDIGFSYKCALKHNLIDNDNIEMLKSYLSKESFRRDFSLVDEEEDAFNKIITCLNNWK